MRANNLTKPFSNSYRKHPGFDSPMPLTPNFLLSTLLGTLSSSGLPVLRPTLNNLNIPLHFFSFIVKLMPPQICVFMHGNYTPIISINYVDLPQGSTLSPILYSLYIFTILNIHSSLLLHFLSLMTSSSIMLIFHHSTHLRKPFYHAHRSRVYTSPNVFQYFFFP